MQDSQWGVLAGPAWDFAHRKCLKSLKLRWIRTASMSSGLFPPCHTSGSLLWWGPWGREASTHLWPCGISAAHSSLVLSLGNSICLSLLFYFLWQLLSRAQSRCNSGGWFQYGSGFHLRESISMSWFICVCVCAALLECMLLNLPLEIFPSFIFPL